MGVSLPHAIELRSFIALWKSDPEQVSSGDEMKMNVMAEPAKVT
jgi:hypothetical protein